MKKVVATARGFHGHLREIGELFEIGDKEKPGAWMRLADQVVEPESEQAPVKIAQTSFAPFTPAEQPYKVKHVAGGTFAVIDSQGEQVGDVFKKDQADNAKAKTSAQQEADRLNGTSVEAAIAPAEAVDNLPDA